MDATLCRKLPNDVIMKIINHATHAANQEYHEDRIKINIPAPPPLPPAGTFLTSLPRNRARFRPTITLRIPEDEYKKLNWSCGRVSWVEQQHRRIITELNDLHRRAQFFFDKTQRKPLPKPWTYSQILVEIIRMDYEGEDISGPDFEVEYLEYLLD